MVYQSSRNSNHPRVPFNAYRLTAEEMQIPCTTAVIDQFFGRILRPIFELLQADFIPFPERIAQFTVHIPQALGTNEFVREISPFATSIWLGEDRETNLRCPEHLWRARPTLRYIHRLEPSEPLENLFPSSLIRCPLAG